MSPADLAVVYGLLGVACGVAVYLTEPGPRGRAAVQAALAVPLWPIWAPLVLTSRPRSADPRAVAEAETSADPRAPRAAHALREAATACAGTPLAGLFTPEAADRIAREIARAAARQAEASAMLARPGFDLPAAAARLAELEAAGGSPRAIATARLHLDNVRRLVSLRDRDGRALDELAELAEALRTQLWLARLAGSDCVQAGDIVAEVWARVEGLDAAIEAHDGAGAPAAPVS